MQILWKNAKKRSASIECTFVPRGTESAMKIYFKNTFFFSQMLRELVPSDLIKLQTTNDWKRSIVAAYNQDAGMSPEDAKITFLKIVYR